jgi:hypothetical protein
MEAESTSGNRQVQLTAQTVTIESIVDSDRVYAVKSVFLALIQVSAAWLY